MPTNPVSRRLLIALDLFVALTAVAGGFCLLTGINVPPVTFLEGSPFRSFTIPGLVLLVIVGGSALVAAVFMMRRHPLGSLTSGVAATMIIAFEIVEVLVIGSPPGVARSLQLFYGTLGVLMGSLAAGIWVDRQKSVTA